MSDNIPPFCNACGGNIEPMVTDISDEKGVTLSVACECTVYKGENPKPPAHWPRTNLEGSE